MTQAPQLPSHMTAVLLTGHGGYEKLSLREDHPRPEPARDEVLIEVGAAGINNTDINTRLGWYSKSVRGATSQTSTAEAPVDGDWSGVGLHFPRIQGGDVCGRIVAVGADIAPDRVGQRVLVQPCLRSRRRGARVPWLGSECDGGFAQFVTAPAAEAHAIASSLSDVELAALPCAYTTAENLIARSRIVAGERVLVTGASGGVGCAAVQLLKRRGADIIAQCATEKQAELRALGAAHTLPRGNSLKGAVAPDSLDAIIDVVGGPQWPQLLDLLKPRGRYAVSGAIAGPIVELDLRTLYLKDLTLFGCTEHDDGVFENLIGYVERGELRPIVARTYALADIVQAQKDFEAKRHVGKLVLLPPARFSRMRA